VVEVSNLGDLPDDLIGQRIGHVLSPLSGRVSPRGCDVSYRIRFSPSWRGELRAACHTPGAARASRDDDADRRHRAKSSVVEDVVQFSGAHAGAIC
jgi:hypothetical protein